ncbi:MAG: hypothetical protein N2035_05230 [Chthoniobacterales bacterium]|nr:hypothetical protein [Chthoniobacterales bacterium]
MTLNKSANNLRTVFPIILVAFLVGTLSWRETENGLLAKLETNLQQWIAESNGQYWTKPLKITVVFQGGITASELSSLDVALFIRAAERLGAKVAAIATPSFINTGVQIPQNVEIPVILGTLLTHSPIQEGVPPLPLPILESNWHLEHFNGFTSPIEAEPKFGCGFLNLPSGVARFPLFASLDGKIVSSFALACWLAYQNIEPSKIESTIQNTVRIGNTLLPVASDATLPLKPETFTSLRRLDMDELILEAERSFQSKKTISQIHKVVEGSVIILGTLLEKADIQGATQEFGRRLSLAEYQGVALASLCKSLSPRKTGFLLNLAIMLFICAVSSFFCLAGRFSLWILAAALVSAWLLAGFAIYEITQVCLPLIFPATTVFAAAMVRKIQLVNTTNQIKADKKV